MPSGMPSIESDKTIEQLAKCAITVDWGLGACDDTVVEQTFFKVIINSEIGIDTTEVTV